MCDFNRVEIGGWNTEQEDGCSKKFRDRAEMYLWSLMCGSIIDVWEVYGEAKKEKEQE